MPKIRKMVEFLKLTNQQIYAPAPEGANPGVRINQEEPVSIHEVNGNVGKPENSGNIIKKMETLKQAFSNDVENSLDESIEEGNSIIEACVQDLQTKSAEVDSLNVELTMLTENNTEAGEQLAQATNTLAELMSKDEEELGEDELENATQKFIEAQKEFIKTEEEKKEAEEKLNIAQEEQTASQEELKNYIEILKEEKEDSQKDEDEDPQTAESFQNAIDKLDSQISTSTQNSDQINNQESQKRQESLSTLETSQNNYGVTINPDGSATQVYEDGSTRTFSIQNDEEGNPIVVFEDTPAENNIEDDTGIQSEETNEPDESIGENPHNEDDSIFDEIEIYT